ncbi:MAG: roadblock/LC7 domain-containing protein [Verrucomicrobiota bacterium]|nr:roadblock/LC7 domain-containing protein [Verrucomicrobiota bacterium]
MKADYLSGELLSTKSYRYARLLSQEMLSFLKNLLKKDQEQPPQTPPAPPSPPTAKPPTTPAAATAAPVPATPKTEAAKPVAPAPAALPPGPTLDVTLKAIVAQFPDTLKSKITRTPSTATVAVPLALILPQLARGAVKVTYAQLRQMAAKEAFPADPASDAVEIQLPLTEILSKLKPDQLPRRAGQKEIQLPEDISPVFGGQNQSTKAPVKAAAPLPPAASAPAPVSAAPPVPAAAPIPPTPPPPAPKPPEAPAKAAAEFSFEEPKLPEQKPISFGSLPQPAGTLPTSQKPPATKPATPAPAGNSVAVPVAAILATLSEAGKNSLAPFNSSSIQIPTAELDAAIRKGKLLFSGKKIQSWLTPPPTASLPPDLEFELPLPVVVPLFLKTGAAPKPQKSVTIDEQIPDVFASKPVQAAPSPSPAPVTPATPPAAPVSPVAETPPISVPSAPPAEPPAQSPKLDSPPKPQPVLGFGEIFGEPGRVDWSPADIVRKTAALRGVAAALIVTRDGLLVAGEVPPTLTASTIAAFIPQMFTRMTQYSRELKLGDAKQITILVENTPLQIFEVGTVYLTILGKAAENLPKHQLTAIAGALARHSK